VIFMKAQPHPIGFQEMMTTPKTTDDFEAEGPTSPDPFVSLTTMAELVSGWVDRGGTCEEIAISERPTRPIRRVKR